MKKHIAVLMGGWNSERDVSLSTGRGIIESLKRQGYKVTSLDLKRDLQELLNFLTPKPDLVFNALHGVYVEDGKLQGILDVMGIPYTHSGVRASAIAMYKPLAKRLYEEAGLPTPKGKVCKWADIQTHHPMETPYVIKPLEEGSSVGVHIISKGEAPLNNRIKWDFGDHVLVEEYIPGRELSCGILGDRALGVIELRSHHQFMDYTAKYTEGQAEHLMPAPIPPHIYTRVIECALKAHQVLGCTGVTRSDFRYNPETEKIYILETNTQPGCTPLSLVPEIAAYAGYSFDDLVHWMVEDGLCQGSER